MTPTVENINANGCDNVFVRYSDGRRERVDPIADSDDELIDLLRMAAARLGIGERRFDLGSPRLSLPLPDGSRLFGVMAVTARPSLSIRRHRYLKITPDDLIGMGTLDLALREFVGAAMRARKSCVICGGTAAGKTTLLRAMAADIPAWERLITIEDSLELGLDRYPDLHPDVVALEAREPNIEGEGGVSLAELVRWALRMSPDRVIVGEARGEEVLALLERDVARHRRVDDHASRVVVTRRVLQARDLRDPSPGAPAAGSDEPARRQRGRLRHLLGPRR